MEEGQLDDVGVINLNGRMYDPLLARFVSADPNIQSPYFMQSYNRYSYAWNNPMGGIDPSGYSFLGDVFGGIGDAIGGVFHSVQSAWKDVWHNDVGRLAITVAVASFTQDWAATAYDASATNAIIDPMVASGATATPAEVLAINAVQTTGAIIGGAAGGFAGGLVGSGGDFHAGVSGAISGGLFGWAGGLTPGDPGSLERYAGHALAGCVGGIASGGCERGAASAIVGNWASNGGFVASAVAGGTISVLGGGKFANGAETAAFGYLFNDCGHSGPCTIRELTQKLVTNFSAGAGGFIHMLSGMGMDSGFAFDTMGNRCVYSNICSTVGPGVAAGLGFPVGVGTGELSTSITTYNGAFWAGGEGIIGEGQALHGQDGSAAAGRSFGGIGGGEATGYMRCAQAMVCF